jgi:hypothetical protein
MNNPYNQRNVQNNNLISGFQNYQKNNIPFQNNNLLSNNPQYQNAISTNINNAQRMQMQEMYQHMARLRKAQEAKKINKFNDVDRIYDPEFICKSVIKPIKEIKEESGELVRRYKTLQDKFEPERQETWNKRTNQPYKNILKSEDYKKVFSKKEDLLVHKVTDADKIGVMKELLELQGLLEKHNGELKIIYSLSNEKDNIKKFEYNHKSKFRIKYDPKDFTDMKEDQLAHIKKEQQRLEKDKKRKDDLIESLLSKGLFIEGITDAIQKEDTLDNEISDLDNMQETMKKELGDEYYKLEKEAERQLEREEIENKTKQTDKPIEKVVKKSHITSKITIKSKSLIQGSNTSQIGTVDKSIKDKYKDRQKKQ